MSKRGTKRKADLELASDESEDALTKGASGGRIKQKRKSRRLSRLEEYDEDEGREGSRNFQRWADIFEKNIKVEATKSKTFMKGFEAKVKKQADRIRDYLHEQENRLDQSKDHLVTIFEKLHSAAILLDVTSGEPDGQARGGDKEGHVLFKEAQSIITGSQSLLQQFKETDEELKKHKVEFPTAKWKQDKQDMKDLLACGREYGEKLVDDRLAPSPLQPHQPNNHKASEKENLASYLFEDSRKELGGDTWGAVAAEQFERVATIVKTVPPKDSARGKH
ncbi:hypothetical protein GGR54DRAFT_583224 [Hypoxylon sp. NC1633]|nr:hypothetical protein GGR54DRAFT_583224 [Hypoxylon sp. NC1633]